MCAHAQTSQPFARPRSAHGTTVLHRTREASSLMRRPSRVRERTQTGAAQRARAASARAAPPPHRERAQWPVAALLRTCASRSAGRARGQDRRVLPRPCTKQSRLLAGAVPFHRAWTDYNQRSAAPARCKHACCASSRERASVVARSRVRTRASRLPVGDCGWHVEARSCTEGERPLAGAMPFQRAWADYSQRGAAPARCKRACCASSRERSSAAARLRVRTRASGLCGRPRLSRRSTAFYRRREPSRWCSVLP